ncbi:MAG TPA: CdaR family protein [Kofleriaceae bacterium]|nr:CdaR family protein [Kofleriaceae bacterium]
MARTRSQSIGPLGRTPARSTTPIPVDPPARPPAERGPIRGWLQSALFENLGLKFLSLVLAVTVFLIVNTDKDREITAHVGVAYKLPDDKVLVSERIDEVRVTIKGAWRRLRKFDEREVERINLDLQHQGNGELPITPDMIHLPSGLSVTSISPRTVHVAFDKRVEKVVEVVATITGRPQHGYVVAEVKPTPATVKLRGGEGMLAALTQIHTREISLEGRTDSFLAESEVAPPDGVEVVGSPPIAVQVHVDEELVTRKMPGVPVAVRTDGDPARWKLTPTQVEVTLTGALLSVEKARGSLIAVVKLGPTDTAASRPREAEVTIDGLPPGVGVKLSPEHVKLTPAVPAAKQGGPPVPPRP